MGIERNDLFIKTMAVFFFQLTLCYFLLEREIDANLMRAEEVKVPSVDLAFVRFITGIIMHISMT